MTYRTIFYLAATAACLGLLLWLIEQHDRETREADPLPPALFPGYDAAQINRLTIERDGWTLEIERRDREWRIVAPFSGRADSERVHHILASIDRLPVREILTPAQRRERGLSLRHFGLDAPRASLTLTDADREYTIRMGEESPLNDGVYVRAANRPELLLTDRSLAGLLPRSKDDLRDRRVLRGTPAEVVRLDIRPYGGSYIQLVRGEDDRWMLQQPLAAHTGRDAVRTRLDPLFDARAIEFLPEASSAMLADYALEEGEAVVQISIWQTGLAETMDLFFGKPVADHENQVYARRGDSSGVFTVPRTVRDAFLTGADDLRDPRVFRMHPWEVTGFELRHGREAVKLALRDHGWQVVQPVQWEADDKKAMDMAVRACELYVQRYLNDLPADAVEMGLDPPQYTLALWGPEPEGAADPAGDAGPANQLLIGARTGDGSGYYARTLHEDNLFTNLFTLPAERLEGLLIGTHEAGIKFTDPTLYHNRTVLAVAPETVWQIEMQRGGRREIVERDSDGNWIAVQPENTRVNMPQLDALLITLEHLQALRVEQHGIEQPAVFGFDRPGLQLTLRMTGTAALSRTLVSGFRARTDGIFVMVQGRDLVFSVSRETMDRLNRELTIPQADERRDP